MLYYRYIHLCIFSNYLQCSRNITVKLLCYIQLNKEINYKYLVLFTNNINQNKSNKYYKPSRVLLKYLNYKE